MNEKTRLPIHNHCATCIRAHCIVKPDDTTSCALTYCESGCGVRLHSCKAKEHSLVCLQEKVPCINQGYGCPHEIVRHKMSSHLPVCPASVVMCPMEWDRWPMHSQEGGWKAPLPFKNPHVKCGQLDVAFALRDQTVLMKSFQSTPQKTRKVLCNAMSTGYPAVPIDSYSSTMDSPSSEASHLSDDDSGTPWDLNQSPPGLQRTLARHLLQDSYKKSEETSTRNQLYAASRQATECLTSALDYVTGKQGLKRLAEIAKQRQEAAEQQLRNQTDPVEKVTRLVAALPLSSTTSLDDKNKQDMFNGNDDEGDELQIYYQKKKLFEILGLDLRMYFISAFQPKPSKMFIFRCGQEFRRDEFSSHYKNLHSDIQCNLDNWFEQRCPLSYAGCTFSFHRFEPCEPSGSIVHSPVLQCIGFCHEQEFQADNNLSTGIVIENQDIQTVVGRRKLREATPEIHTSCKCDSNINVIPRYKSDSRESTPVKVYETYETIDEHPFTLTDLPFEVLQNIIQHLDGFSLLHLSLTCKLLRNVCCTLLSHHGLVSIVWKKVKSPDDVIGQSSWEVSHKRWHFSTSFQHIARWKLTERCLSAIHDHLKVCPYNQDPDRNIKMEPFQVLSDITDEQ